jgi:hypothetical protein
LLLAHGLVRRVRAIDVVVHPIGGGTTSVWRWALNCRRLGRRRRRLLVCSGLESLGRSCTRWRCEQTGGGGSRGRYGGGAARCR